MWLILCIYRTDGCRFIHGVNGYRAERAATGCLDSLLAGPDRVRRARSARNHLVTSLALRVGGRGLGEDAPVGQVLAPRTVNLVGDLEILIPRMNHRPTASIAFWLASEIIPASATTVTSAIRWAAVNASMRDGMVLVSDRGDAQGA